MLLNSNSIHPITQDLLLWYSTYKRSLPWREKPEAYFVWLAEIIFQQTRIEQGLSYYEKITDRFPNVFDLAMAEEQEILKLWEGLGYYSRARNLHFSAKMIVNDFNGVFPSKYEDILSLKGVGPYTAAAISSIAFKLPYPSIDGNVLRVASRLFCISEPINSKKTYNKIEEELKEIIDKENPGDFNQALMELGSLICKPQNPLCEKCPLLYHCQAHEKGIHKSLPVKDKKVKVKKVFFNYLVTIKNDTFGIEKRIAGIWKNLYQFPLVESDTLLTEKEIAVHFESSGKIELIESEIYKHILSHRIIYAKFWIQRSSDEKFKDQLVRIEKSELKKYPMPRLITRFLESDEAKKYILA